MARVLWERGPVPPPYELFTSPAAQVPERSAPRRRLEDRGMFSGELSAAVGRLECFQVPGHVSRTWPKVRPPRHSEAWVACMRIACLW